MRKRRLRKKKRVRFQGVASPYTASFMSLLVHVFRSGSPVASCWEFTVACGTIADLILIPLSMLGQMFKHHEEAWHARFNGDIAAHLSRKFLVFRSAEVWMDALFLAHLFFTLARACVRDLGYEDSPVDRLVNAAPTDVAVHKKSAQDNMPTLALDIEGKEAESLGRFRIGKAFRWQLVQCCMRVLLMSLEWIVLIAKACKHRVHIVFTMISALVRMYRLGDLWGYFTDCQEDVAQDVRWVAFFKFAFIIFATVRSLRWKGVYRMSVASASYDENCGLI